MNRTVDDYDLDSFVDALVRRLASFDREPLAAAKAQINRFGTPTASELRSSNEMIFPMVALPSAQARRAKLRNIGYGLPSDFELNFGRYSLRSGRRARLAWIRSPTDQRQTASGAPQARFGREHAFGRRKGPPNTPIDERRELMDTTKSDAIRPFRVNVSDAELTELRRRISATRGPTGKPQINHKARRSRRCRNSRATGRQSTTGARSRRD